MANIVQDIQEKVSAGVKALYDADFAPEQVPINTTRKDVEGDYTVVCFPFTKIARKAPPAIAEELGAYLWLPEVGVSWHSVFD